MRKYIILSFCFLIFIIPFYVSSNDNEISVDEYYKELPIKLSNVTYSFNNVSYGFRKEEINNFEKGKWYRYHFEGSFDDDFQIFDSLYYFYKLDDTYYEIIIEYGNLDLMGVVFGKSTVANFLYDFEDVDNISSIVAEKSLNELLGIKEENSDIPGFEFAILSIAIITMLFFKRKKKG